MKTTTHHPATQCGAPAVRAVRGATQTTYDTPRLIEKATGELLTEIMRRNGLAQEDFISILFTATPDLSSAYPAATARELGLTDVPLMCATEIAVPGSLSRTIRILAHVHTPKTREAIRHVYLGGTKVLRPDLTTADTGSTPPLPQGE
ncbi:chorismate mutase [Streptomyces luteolus]|uniref:chorismate mutase n=1 Tax=Streptomyces luteolus TaxID=3043615 RepID=A0ABT6T369_9ACTN|nr:chorismate mutase [Streptomyces sp. B-S-A12]MDI3422101.1 chorismate mutase [Streptomyces sp. B-S-A12]